MKLINTQRSIVFLPFKAEPEEGTRRLARAVDGQLIEIEETTVTNKVKGGVTVPDAGKLTGPGELVITKAQFAKLDPAAIEAMGIIVSS